KSPQILPGGKAVLFSATNAVGRDRWDKADVAVYSRDTGKRKVVFQGGSAARYEPTGHIVFAVANNLMALPSDIARLQAKGGPVPIAEGLIANPLGTGNFDFSSTGTFVYIPSDTSFTATAPRMLAFVDRKGKSEVIAIPPGAYDQPRLSWDGKALAVVT